MTFTHILIFIFFNAVIYIKTIWIDKRLALFTCSVSTFSLSTTCVVLFSSNHIRWAKCSLQIWISIQIALIIHIFWISVSPFTEITRSISSWTIRITEFCRLLCWFTTFFSKMAITSCWIKIKPSALLFILAFCITLFKSLSYNCNRLSYLKNSFISTFPILFNQFRTY